MKQCATMGMYILAYCGDRRMRLIPVKLSCWLLSLLVSIAAAQGSIDTDITQHGIHSHLVKDGPYTMRASTLQSDSLTPAIAQRHGITVAPDRGILNVVVLKQQGDTRVTVPTDITAISINLLGQTEPISMREVIENDHVSYIGSFGFQPLRNLRFVINAKPRGGIEPFALEFEDRFVAK
jgi:Domain of unknown function (DUF4426)